MNDGKDDSWNSFQSYGLYGQTILLIWAWYVQATDRSVTVTKANKKGVVKNSNTASFQDDSWDEYGWQLEMMDMTLFYQPTENKKSKRIYVQRNITRFRILSFISDKRKKIIKMIFVCM